MDEIEKLACGCCSTLIGAGVVLSDPNAVNCVMLPIVRSALREAQRMAYKDAAMIAMDFDESNIGECSCGACIHHKLKHLADSMKGE